MNENKHNFFLHHLSKHITIYMNVLKVSEATSWSSFFSLPLDPQILAVINNQDAYFPNATMSFDPFYPPVTAKSSTKAQRKAPPLKRGTSRRLSTKPRPVAFPHNQEMIASLPTLCFPSEAFLQQSKPPETFQYLVLTSISGSRSYATCLTFHRQYLLIMTQDGKLELQADSSDSTSVKCWVPSCICVISSQPYFLVMKQCLST